MINTTPPKILNDEKTCSSTTMDETVKNFIRAEVIATMNDQAQVNSAELLSDKSSALLLTLSPFVDAEGQQTITSIEKKPKSRRQSWKDVIRGCLSAFALLITFTLWMPLLATGLDPLGFSALALILLLCICAFLGLFMFVIGEKNGAEDANREVRHPDSVKWDGVKVTWGLLLSYLMFYGIILAWSVTFSEAPSLMYSHYLASSGLQSKVSIGDVTGKLSWCLKGSLPDRDATVEDFVTCLKAMGMKKYPGDVTAVKTYYSEANLNNF